MRGGAGTHTSIAACAIIEIDEEEILRLEQSLIKKIIQVQSDRNGILLVGGEARRCHRLELRTHIGEFLEHEIKIVPRNLHDIDGIERGAGGGPFNCPEQSNFAEVI